MLSKIRKNEFCLFAVWIIGMSSYGVYVIITNGL
jgi:hypothetical protein